MPLVLLTFSEIQLKLSHLIKRVLYNAVYIQSWKYLLPEHIP